MFWLRNKKINFLVRTLNLRPDKRTYSILYSVACNRLLKSTSEDNTFSTSMSKVNVSGCSFAVTSTEPGEFMVIVSGSTRGLNPSCSGFKAPQKTGPRLKVSANKTGRAMGEKSTFKNFEMRILNLQFAYKTLKFSS